MATQKICTTYLLGFQLTGGYNSFCLLTGSTNFVILAVLTLVVKGSWHFRQASFSFFR